jgi:hypothetical protein
MVVQPYDQFGNVFYSYDSLAFEFVASSKGSYDLNGEGNKRELKFQNIVDYFVLDVATN